jgi:hypothetical protein
LDLFNNPVGCCWTNVRQVSQIWRISCRNPPYLLFFSGSCSITEVIEQLYYGNKGKARKKEYMPRWSNGPAIRPAHKGSRRTGFPGFFPSSTFSALAVQVLNQPFSLSGSVAAPCKGVYGGCMNRRRDFVLCQISFYPGNAQGIGAEQKTPDRIKNRRFFSELAPHASSGPGGKGGFLLERIARSPAGPGMRPSPNGDAVQPVPYSTGLKGLMRPSPQGDAVQPVPYSTGPEGLMRPSPNGDAVQPVPYSTGPEVWRQIDNG